VTVSPIIQRDVEVTGGTLHLAEAGAADAPAVVFLHGWPEDWTAWSGIMRRAASTHRAIALDLPGIGGSADVRVGGGKAEIALIVREAVLALGLTEHTVVGHDAGAMVAYAYLRRFADELKAAVLMNSVIPGVEPWAKVLANPYLWHFAFHSVPDLPELLVAGHERPYLDFFFNYLVKERSAFGEVRRDYYAAVYSEPRTLRTGFDWYRGFARDAEVNRADTSTLDTSVLYLRGEFEGVAIDAYIDGFREAGVSQVTPGIVAGSGHFAPEENPDAVWSAIAEFIDGLS
jgi:pimeloyl-ACP methyl ester carboxylesterase